MKHRKERLDVVLDIDGVIADFEGGFCDVFGYDRRHLVRLQDRYPEHRGSIDNYIHDRSSYRHLTIEPVGVEIAKWLMTRVYRFDVRQTRAYVHIVSARPLNFDVLTREWLAYNHVPHHDLTITPNKESYIAHLKPDIMVDDIIGVCETVQKAVPDVQPVLVAHPWNEDTAFIPRITTLNQFQEIYQKVAGEKLLTDTGGTGLA